MSGFRNPLTDLRSKSYCYWNGSRYRYVFDNGKGLLIEKYSNTKY